jgi:pyruvate dehydrogenase E1 component
MLLTSVQVESLREELGIPAGQDFIGFEPGSPEWQFLSKDLDTRPDAPAAEIPTPPTTLEQTYAGRLSTQEAFARVLSGLARHPSADYVVTTSPDVALSTHLGGWVNRRGVYARHTSVIDYFARENVARSIRWSESARGQHIELGISENNLFLLLAALGLAGDMEGQRIIPVGTIYDPFICRGLDALIYAVYSGARFIVVATPSGVSLAPEGGAHQSSITASIGIELPGLDYFEPTFAQEVEWILLDAVDRLRQQGPGLGVYLRLSTLPIDQQLFPLRSSGLREQVLAGGYRIVDRRSEHPYEPEENVVNVFAMGAIVPEAIAASDTLRGRGILANVFAVTAPGRLYRNLVAARRGTDGDSYVESFLETRERRAPVVTVADAHSHALRYIGSALGGRTIALGVDVFGESGTCEELYRKMGIDRDSIVQAAERAIVELDSYQ